MIKKEAERKKMERLLAGDGTNERRKSIKTYREIVEEKYVVFLECSGMSANAVCSIGDKQLWAAMPASLSEGEGRMLMEQRKWV